MASVRSHVGATATCSDLAFERTQAKGSFKVMTDRVAERLDADIILAASSVKPEYKGKPTLLSGSPAPPAPYRGPIVLN